MQCSAVQGDDRFWSANPSIPALQIARMGHEILCTLTRGREQAIAITILQSSYSSHVLFSHFSPCTLTKQCIDISRSHFSPWLFLAKHPVSALQQPPASSDIYPQRQLQPALWWSCCCCSNESIWLHLEVLRVLNGIANLAGVGGVISSRQAHLDPGA